MKPAKKLRPLYRVNLGFERRLGIYRLRRIKGTRAIGAPKFYHALDVMGQDACAWLKRNRVD